MHFLKKLCCVEVQKSRNELGELLKIKKRRLLFGLKIFKSHSIGAIWGKDNRVLLNGKAVQNLPGVFVSIEGKNNLIALTIQQNTKLKNIKIFIKGDGNKVILDNPQEMSDISFHIFGDGNVCEFNKVKSCGNSEFWLTDMGDKREFFNNRKLIIDEGLCCCGIRCFFFGNDKIIRVGKNCLFSWGVYLWNTDAHYIYDKNTGTRLNEESDIYIGDHVWIGRNVSIHRGTVIPNECVIGANSFISKIFYESNCIIAGTPAKIIRKNIKWEK